MRTFSRALTTLILGVWLLHPAAQEPALPLKNGSVRFLVIGDSGTGDKYQYELAQQMVKARTTFPYAFAIMLGDNLYGSERPQDYLKKFETPYKPLLDAKVEFNAVLGNHDDPNQRFYKPFNLGGERYRTFKKGNARFFALDSNYMDPQQLEWLKKELQASGSDWKIPYFHHPLYSSGMHGPTVELRAALEPIFIREGVSVVFAGHEHFYERIKPQQGIYHFIAGGSAKTRKGDIKKTAQTDAGFDIDRSFMIVEISGDEMYFQTISRTGATVDKGMIKRRTQTPDSAPARSSAPAAPAAPRR